MKEQNTSFARSKMKQKNGVLQGTRHWKLELIIPAPLVQPVNSQSPPTEGTANLQIRITNCIGVPSSPASKLEALDIL